MSEKISALTQIATGAIAGNDEFIVVDPNDTTTGPAGPGGSDKIMTLSQMLAQLSASLKPTGTAVGDEALVATMVTEASANTYGGTVECAAGDWRLSGGALAAIERSGITFRWQPGSRIIGSGTGTLIRMYDPSAYVGRTVNGGGILGNPTFDISAMGAGSCAVHMGDILSLQAYLTVQTFGTVPNLPGFWLDSVEYWNERVNGLVNVVGCNATIDNSANLSGQATGSWERSLLEIYCTSNGMADGVVMNNGAASLGYKLGIYGNFLNSATQYAVLRIEGSNAGGYSGLAQGEILIGVENDGGSGLNPYTIYLAAGGNYVTGATGAMQFAGAFTPCNSGAILFDGPVLGDSNIVSYETLGTNALAETITANGQTIFTVFDRVIAASPGSTSYTGLILQPGEFNFQPATIVNTGTGSLTFAAAGTSNVANGTGAVIAANTGASFTWNATNNLWYRTV